MKRPVLKNLDNFEYLGMGMSVKLTLKLEWNQGRSDEKKKTIFYTELGTV